MNDHVTRLLDGMLKSAEQRMPQVSPEVSESIRIEKQIASKERDPLWIADLLACLSESYEAWARMHVPEHKLDQKVQAAFDDLINTLSGMKS